jgi:hypothetical protein
MTSLAHRIREIQRVSGQQRFLQARIDAEKKACQLLDRRAGRFTKEEFCRFLDLCNAEIVPPRTRETKTRFQQSFIGQNRCLMLDALKTCNDLIVSLWKAEGNEHDILDSFWCHSDVKGAGTGLPTMILYLKRPKTHSVWLVSFNEPMSDITGQTLPTRRTANDYSFYNRVVNERLRKPYRLKPQEIDYVLYRLSADA